MSAPHPLHALPAFGVPSPIPRGCSVGMQHSWGCQNRGDARGGVGVLEGATQWGCPINKGAWLIGVSH